MYDTEVGTSSAVAEELVNLCNAEGPGYVGCAICLERKGKGECVESDTHH